LRSGGKRRRQSSFEEEEEEANLEEEEIKDFSKSQVEDDAVQSEGSEDE
jgi:hypothetical protein